MVNVMHCLEVMISLGGGGGWVSESVFAFGGGEPMMLEVFFLQLSSAVCWAMILQEVMGIRLT
jgi:hypothetical protein